MLKLPKLEKATNYIQWQRRVKAYLRKDYYPVSLNGRPEDAEEDVLEYWN